MKDNRIEDELVLNRQAYEKLRTKICRDFAGQYVAMAFGKVVAVSPDFQQVQKIVDELDPHPDHVLVFIAGNEPVFEPVTNIYKEFI